MDTPQEVEVWFVLPALRKQFVIALKKQGLKQKEIAKIMNLSEPAVSQYIKDKRGNNVNFSEKVVKDIEKSSQKIQDKISYRKEFQKMFMKIKKSRMICEICHDHIDSNDNCEICYT